MQRVWVFLLIELTLASLSWAADTNSSSVNTLNGLPNPAPTGQGAVSTVSTDQMENSIIEAFTQGDCARVNSTTDRKLLDQFRPLVIAVVAYCGPSRAEAEKLFDQAEKKASHDDLILVLHARYLFRIDPEAAKPLWGKIYVVAHNAALKRIAQDYLEGTATEGEGLAIFKNWTVFGSYETSGGYEDNPTGQAASLGTRPSSAAWNNILYAGGSRALPSGNSIGLNATVTTNTYFSAHYADFWQNDLDAPYSFRVGNNEDLILHPFGRYSQYGDLTYEVMGGFAVTGVAYRENYKQYVQTSVFQSHYFVDVVSPESGTHFRFEYNWEFYPSQDYVRFLAFIEHVFAQTDTTFTPDANIPYSHNDVGATLYFDHRFRNFVLSFYPSIAVREDDQDSTYEDGNGDLINKHRSDMTVDLKMRVSVPINRTFEAIAFCDWTRVYSTMGVGDYLDRNYIDQTVGAGIRVFLANY